MMKEKRALVAAIALAWLPVFVGIAYPAVWEWSTTASSNASADPQINWREGMPPSAVNDSARAMMAALASYRDDISGLLTTTGTASAYSVSTNQNLCASPATVPQDGQQLALTMNATNGVAATLTADACATYPIQSAAGAAVGAATLIQGSPYTFRFSVANSAWMLRDFYGSALTVPLGSMIAYTGTTVPNSNYVFPAGQCISTTTYAAYWALIGSPASGSCSGGQFQIIDMRGRVPAALDNLNGTAASRLTSASAGCGTAMTSVGAVCANGAESQTLTAAQIPQIVSYNNASPNYNLSSGLTQNNVDLGIGVSTTGGGGTGINVVVSSGSASVTGFTTITANTLSSVSTNTGNGSHPNVPPIIALPYLLRVI